MQLPVRMSSAQTLLADYANIISAYVGDPESNKSILLNQLNQALAAAEKISNSMLTALGYTQGNLEDKEKELNTRIQELQKGTNYLNGSALADFFIRELARAMPYSISLQKQYEAFLAQQLGKAWREEIDNIDENDFAKLILNASGIDISQYSFNVSNIGTGGARGFGGGRARGSTAFIKKSIQFTDLPSKVRERLMPTMKVISNTFNETLADDNITYEIDINEDTIYNILSLKTTPYTDAGANKLIGINEIVKSIDPNVVEKTKEVLRQKLLSEYSGSYRNVFQHAVDFVLEKANPRDLFAGKNAVKKITGLFGEIQGLYYLNVIIPAGEKDRISANWTATQLNDDNVQPHADLVLDVEGRKYGIQVKNTALPDATQEVAFHSFKGGLEKATVNGKLDINMLTQNTLDMLPQFTGSNIVFEAAAGLMAMEQFNIPYIWTGEQAQAVPYSEAFNVVRQGIEKAAAQARLALTSYLTSMMYIQLGDIKTDEANTLYLIGGTLAITSATILKQIIDDLKSQIQRFTFEWKTEKQKENYTIVDFLNAGHGNHFNQQFVLSSSYTFTKPTIV